MREQEKEQEHALPGVYIRTFGCQMNVYDTEKIFKVLEGEYRPVEEPAQAKLILINTCSIREKPEHKLYSLLGELRELKTQDPELLVGVGGCVAQQEGQRIVDRSREVDFVFGTHNISLVRSLIGRRRETGEPQVAVDYRDEWEDLPLGFSGAQRASVFISISRGCNKNCTYCIVPTTRGPEVSRAMDEILREVRISAHRGAKEIVLLGQTVNSYGRDLSPKRSFVDLIEAVSAVEGIERIRFTSPHPQEVRDDLVDCFAKNPKMCRHIHLPLQSGSDRILKMMNRNYRRARYLEIVGSLRAKVPEISITTDVIVGFPGETESDFEETMSVMEQVKFDGSYSFIFSPRPGTVAESLPDRVPREDALRRLQTLQSYQDALSDAYLESWVGRETEILLDGFSRHETTRLQGRTSQNLLVNFEAEYPQVGPGMLVEAKITAAAQHTLRAELVQN